MAWRLRNQDSDGRGAACASGASLLSITTEAPFLSLNTPEVAILLVGRSRQLSLAIDGKVEVRLMMPLSLSYDHRLVDGATAARFLNDVIGYLKAPSRLLLAP